MGVSKWVKQLITKEDPLQVHKTLGFLALSSFIWRLSQFGEADMGFASHPSWTLPTILVHLCLNLSSFEFHIPAKRISSDGGRIWPEYRLHSLCFASRSLACILINWYEQQYEQEPNYNLNLFAVLGAMTFADISSGSVQHKSKSIRDLSAPAAVKYYFSVMQMMATTAVLFGNRRSSMHFYFILVIQLTAFLMTLRRKNLVAHAPNVVFYGVLLAGGVATGIYENYEANLVTILMLVIVSCTAALWRMGPWPALLRNKYFMWTTLHFVVIKGFLRPVLEGEPDALLTVKDLWLIASCTLSLMILYGVFKHMRAATEKKD